MNRKNFLKNKKINWIKGKYFMGKCEVFGMDAVGNCAGNSTCGKVFLWIFLQFWSSAGFAMAWITQIAGIISGKKKPEKG